MDLELEENRPYYPRHPDFVVYVTRLKTFASWPEGKTPTPAALAEAGFFKAPVPGDKVACYVCGCYLRDWDPNDIPWEEHALWSTNCKLVYMVKGEEFVQRVKAKYENSAQATGGAPVDIVDTVTFELGSCNISQPKPVVEEVDEDEVKRQRINSLPSYRVCKICYEDEANTVYLDCGHVVACVMCAMSFLKCPVCCRRYRDIVRVRYE